MQAMRCCELRVDQSHMDMVPNTMEIIGYGNRPSQYPLNVRGADKFDIDMLSVELNKRTISQATGAYTV